MSTSFAVLVKDASGSAVLEGVTNLTPVHVGMHLHHMKHGGPKPEEINWIANGQICDKHSSMQDCGIGPNSEIKVAPLAAFNVDPETGEATQDSMLKFIESLEAGD